MELRNLTGEGYRGLVIVQDTGLDTVTCECINCGSRGLYDRYEVTHNRALCKECVAAERAKRKRKRHMEVLEYLGRGRIACICHNCGHEDEYRVATGAYIKLRCKKCGKNYLDRTGEVHKDLQVIEDSGTKTVKCECVNCGNIDEYNKVSVIGDKTSCRVCTKHGLIDRVGQVHHGLKILEELGCCKVKCECIKCGKKHEYNKSNVVSGSTSCIYCRDYEKQAMLKRFIDRTGQTFRGLTIIKDPGKKKVICKCTRCGHIDEYQKNSLTALRTRCKKCKSN